MKPGKIIKRAVINDQEFVFRLPKKDDLEDLCRYINTLSQERTFIRFQGEEVTLEQEADYLDDLLEKIKKNRVLAVLVLNQGEIIGS